MSNNLQVSFANVSIPKFELAQKTSHHYYPFGDNNLFPYELQNFASKSVTHGSMIEVLSRAIAGDGVDDENVKIFIQNICESDYGTTIIEKIASDLAIYDAFCLQIIWTKDKSKIAKIYHIDVKDVRVSKNTDELVIGDFRYSSQYNKVSKFFPNGDRKTPSEFIYVRRPNPFSNIYGVPHYVQALNYIALEYELSKNNLSTVVNSVLPTTHINIPGLPTDDEKKEIFRKTSQQFQGSENAGRFILTFDDPDMEKSVTINSIQPQIDSEMFKYYQDEAKQQILTAHGATSPVLAGIPKQGSLGGDGSEIEAAWDIYNKQVASTYHRLIEDVFNIFLKINGIESKMNINKYIYVNKK